MPLPPRARALLVGVTIVVTSSATALPVTSGVAAPRAHAPGAPPVTATSTTTAAASGAGGPGAAGIGDRLYPTLGNGGYDAKHYDLRLRYATAAPTQGIDGTLTMRARARQNLTRFDLDFGGTSVGGVSVDGRRAAFSRVGDELIVVPSRTIHKHHTFRVRVSHFRATPSVPTSENFLATGFVATPDGSAVAGQPSNAHQVFPSNDHPRDKASYSFRIDVPRGQTAVANGVLTSKRTRGSRTVWRYEQRQPMATELTQLAVGRYTVIKRSPVAGVVVRDVVPTRLLATYRTKLAVEREHLRWMTARVGRYPFDTYGSFVVQADLGFALETQTLSLYDSVFFGEPEGLWSPVMLHELSHQWFGDSVAPYEWSDVWQNEGHATWYELTYASSHGYLADETGIADFDQLMKVVYSLGDEWRRDDGPVARPLSGNPEAVFNVNVYYGGALVLYALRQKIGAAAFDEVERAWVKRNRGRSVSTEDFIALATRVSGVADVDRFLRVWLYGTTTPPMPGHPDWTVAPPSSDGARAAARSASPLRRLPRH